jgi:hypothetical protein
MIFTPELLSLLGGGLAGFVFKHWAQQASDRQQITELLIKKQDAADASSDKASKRDQSEGGKWIRRFLAVAVMSGIILFPFLLTLLHEPTVVSETTPVRSFLGLFEWGGREKFFELYGYYLSPEIRTAVLGIIGYYFGNASATRK